MFVGLCFFVTQKSDDSWIRKYLEYNFFLKLYLVVFSSSNEMFFMLFSHFDFFFFKMLHEEVLEEYRKIQQVCVAPGLWELETAGMGCSLFLSKGHEILNFRYFHALIFFLSLQSSPNYREEKHRCEYLHNKLSHIKRLIGEFDQQQSELRH